MAAERHRPYFKRLVYAQQSKSVLVVPGQSLCLDIHENRNGLGSAQTLTVKLESLNLKA